jgi:GNAT superfamily N-acetyltransferase
MQGPMEALLTAIVIWLSANYSLPASFDHPRVDWIVGAFLEDRLRNVVEIYSGDLGGRAEAALVVEREWRRQGLGWALLRAAMQVAADAETKALRMIFSRHNWGMRKLAAKAGGRLDVILGEIVVDVALDEGADQHGMRQRLDDG